MSETIGDEVLKMANIDEPHVNYQAKIQQFSPIQLRLLKDIEEERWKDYDMILFRCSQFIRHEVLKAEDKHKLRILALEVELDHQEKQIEEESKYKPK